MAYGPMVADWMTGTQNQAQRELIPQPWAGYSSPPPAYQTQPSPYASQPPAYSTPARGPGGPGPMVAGWQNGGQQQNWMGGLGQLLASLANGQGGSQWNGTLFGQQFPTIDTYRNQAQAAAPGVAQNAWNSAMSMGYQDPMAQQQQPPQPTTQFGPASNSSPATVDHSYMASRWPGYKPTTSPLTQVQALTPGMRGTYGLFF